MSRHTFGMHLQFALLVAYMLPTLIDLLVIVLLKL